MIDVLLWLFTGICIVGLINKLEERDAERREWRERMLRGTYRGTSGTSDTMP